MGDRETSEPIDENAGGKRRGRSWRIWMLIVIVPALTIAVFAWVCPPLDVRLVNLTCIHCGNHREMFMARRWWVITDVRVGDIIYYPIEADHEHRWYQWSSKRQTSWNYESWVRDDYETGDWRWPGDVKEEELTREENELIREDWLR